MEPTDRLGLVLTGRAGRPEEFDALEDEEEEAELDTRRIGDVTKGEAVPSGLPSERRELSISLRIRRSRSKSRPISDSKRRLLEMDSHSGRSSYNGVGGKLRLLMLLLIVFGSGVVTATVDDVDDVGGDFLGELSRLGSESDR